MLRNLVEVLRLLATAKPSASGAGLELLLAARGSEDGGAAQQLPPRQSSAAYVQREADAAWDCVQVSTSSTSLLTHPAQASSSKLDSGLISCSQRGQRFPYLSAVLDHCGLMLRPDQPRATEHTRTRNSRHSSLNHEGLNTPVRSISTASAIEPGRVLSYIQTKGQRHRCTRVQV